MSEFTGEPAQAIASAADVPTDQLIPTTPVASMGDVAIRGAAWTSIAWGAGTVASFASQLVLGWKLSKEDFAKLGVVMTIASLGLSFADAGLRKVLISRPRDISFTAWPAFVIALFFNVIVIIALISFTRWGAPIYFGRSDLMPLALLFSAVIFIGTFGVSPSATLTIDRRFKFMAGVVILGNVGRHTMAIVLALLGVGVYAYVIPMAVIQCFNLALALQQVGWVHRRPGKRSIYTDMIRQAAWIQLASFAAMVTMTGDYWVGGRSLSNTNFGEYYFGFQLAQAISGAIGSVLLAVLTPTFALMKSDDLRQRGAIRTSNSLVASMLVLVSIIGVMIAPLAVHSVWRGKWDGAIYVVQAVTALLWCRSLSVVAQSVIDAGAYWVLNLVATLAYAFAVVLGAVIGSELGGFTGFVTGVVVAHAMATLGLSAYTARLAGCELRSWAHDTLLPAAIGVTIFAAYILVTKASGLPMQSYIWSASWAMPVAIVYIIAIGLISPSHSDQLRATIRRLSPKVRGHRE